MPPKKQQGPSKKNEQKKKEKVIEDKTFGLKNKKGAKQQKFVEQVQKQVIHGGKSKAQLEAEKLKEKKKTAQDELNDLNKLLKPVLAMPKVGKDVDPKSVLCVFFKQGMCSKKDKCKFSHDLAIERKSEKRNIYVDTRESDGIDNWDESKLNEVVEKKHGEADKLKPRTAIICKYFLDALENSKYGWFWECPNGPTCIYRHALPPGYVLKKDRKKLDELKEDEVSLEELVEKERAALGHNVTKVTYETFVAWKKRKLSEKKKNKAKEETRKASEFKAGKQQGLSGKDLFTFNPDFVTQDDDEADDTSYKPVVEEGEESTVEAREIDERMFVTDLGEIEEEGLGEASGGGRGEEAASSSVAFNEDLFNPDDIPDSDLEDGDDDGDNLANGVAAVSLSNNGKT